jgi:alkanesulfonate monooxygenase SsuD/methylene tetrahydromethanopterin reductase-like flavin-dependent oxidoreductase (luciferase family)
VTVISSDDPVRVFQDFATLDLLTGGRAEIMVGRGSFVESFPLFGYDLHDYDELFDEKLRLLLELRTLNEQVSWPAGSTAPRSSVRPVHPRPLQDPLPVWVAVGGNPPSVVRAASLGLPMALAIIGGDPRSSCPLFDLYREAHDQAGHDPATLPLSINSHGFVAETSQQAADLAFPAHRITMDRIGRERGWPPMSRQDFDAAVTAARRLRGRQPGSRSPRRSCGSTSGSATTGSCSSSPSGRCPTSRHAGDRAVRHRGGPDRPGPPVRHG